MNEAGTIVIEVSDAERAAVLKTLIVFNEREHVRQMPLQSIADATGIKVTKVRHVMEDLMRRELITRYNVSDRPVRPRYYYVLTEAAREWLATVSSEA